MMVNTQKAHILKTIAQITMLHVLINIDNPIFGLKLSIIAFWVQIIS